MIVKLIIFALTKTFKSVGCEIKQLPPPPPDSYARRWISWSLRRGFCGHWETTWELLYDDGIGYSMVAY